MPCVRARSILHWLRKLNFCERAETRFNRSDHQILRCLVQSGRGNVSGRYPSRKMGVTIQFESYKNELARIQELEHASDVIEFYDQPHSIKLEYQSAAGKKLGACIRRISSSFVRLRRGWEECKMEEDPNRLAEKIPNRYCRDETGRWRCRRGKPMRRNRPLLPGHLLSRDQLGLQRNIIFLDDYLRADLPIISESVSTAVRLLLANNPGLTLEELFGKTEGIATRDDWPDDRLRRCSR